MSSSLVDLDAKVFGTSSLEVVVLAAFGVDPGVVETATAGEDLDQSVDLTGVADVTLWVGSLVRSSSWCEEMLQVLR